MIGSKTPDYLWWAIAAIIGLGSVWMPVILGIGTTSLQTLIIAHIDLFISGVVLGFLNPERPWRWSLGSVLLFPIVEFLGMLMQLPSASFMDSLLYVVVKSPVYLLQALPALVGAYLGAFAKLGGRKAGTSTRAARWWGFGILVGLIATGISLQIVGRELAFLVWISGIVLLSAIVAFIQPYRVWQAAIAVSIGSFTAVVLRIVVDISQQRASHNLWPIELFVSLSIAVPSAFAGVYIGTLVKRMSKKMSSENMPHGL